VPAAVHISNDTQFNSCDKFPELHVNDTISISILKLCKMLVKVSYGSPYLEP